MHVQTTSLQSKMVPKTASLSPKMVSKTTSLYPKMVSKTKLKHYLYFLKPEGFWSYVPPSTWRSLFENYGKKNDYRNIFHTIWFHSNFQGLERSNTNM